MKKILILILVAFILGCNSDTKTKNDTPSIPEDTSTEQTETDNSSTPKKDAKPSRRSTGKSEIVSSFLSNINSLKDIEGKNPIIAFQELAENEANEVLMISKDNIEDVLSSAKGYKNLVITTGDHTIVSISDIENCKPSGAWGACMPYAKGFIKKGDLISKEDYINNIIGIPDSQVRKAYLFN